MEKIDLFSSPVWKVKIPPNSYNKQEILEVVEHNYNLQPIRNTLTPTFDSTGHHYYRDWDNPNFKEVNMDPLNTIYKEIIKDFGSQIKVNQLICCEYEIVNIHASKSNQNLKMHDHPGTFYSTVHYVSLKKEHQVTKFYNPLIIAQYASTISDVKELVANDISNSNYFHHWNLEVEEDDFILFPSYLKHEVTETPKTENLRVTLSTNIIIRSAGI